MATSITDKGSLVKDPDAERVIRFDWDADLPEGAEIDTSTWIVSPSGELATDNAAIADDGRSATVRLTGGEAGSSYTLTNRIVTDTTPAETEDASITVHVREQ